MADRAYEEMRRENERFAAVINSKWNAPVAWVEDETITIETIDKRGHRVQFRRTLPVIKSKMVNGLVPGLTPPPWHVDLRVAA